MMYGQENVKNCLIPPPKRKIFCGHQRDKFVTNLVTFWPVPASNSSLVLVNHDIIQDVKTRIFGTDFKERKFY